jgi:hypothetical protein
LQKYQSEIRTEAQARGITHLLHFTPLENLASILEIGMVSQKALAEDAADGIITDRQRWDGYPDHICFSVHGINDEMFQLKKRDHPNWAMIAVDISVIWEQSCRFCWRNAATNEIRHTRGFIGGPWAFLKMFDDEPMSVTDPRSRRQVLELKECWPTDHQAEVQVKDTVAIEKIVEIGVPSERHKGWVEALMKKRDRNIAVAVIDSIR